MSILKLEDPSAGTDADFDRYAVEVMNGEGYYDDNGNFVRYNNL